MLLSSRTTLDDDSERRIGELVLGEFDWATLVATAHRHQVMPLVAATLLARHRADMPTPIETHLSDYSRALTAQNMHMTAVLLNVLNALDQASVPALPYKGPSLAVTAYGNLRLRAFGDLDILVPRHRYLEAVSVLEDLGYRPLRPARGNRRHYLGHASAHAFEKDGTHIDLQWGTTYRKALSVPVETSLWETGDRVNILGRDVKAIPPDLLFLFVCAHGARHHWDRLKWVCDVAEMIRSHPDFDWLEILSRAKDAGSVRVVYMAITLADRLLGVEVPSWVHDSAKNDEKAMALADLAVEHNLFAGGEAEYDRSEHLRFTLATKERRLDRIRYMRGFLFHPALEDYDWVTLPDILWFLYPVIRPLRLLIRAIKRRTGVQSAHDH